MAFATIINHISCSILMTLIIYPFPSKSFMKEYVQKIFNTGKKITYSSSIFLTLKKS